MDTLNFYTHLTNDDLTGGSLNLSVRELIGLVSRPSASDEEWFPSLSGDWVELDDETIGKVVYQSPEMVQLVLLGGSHITYTTENYIGLNPKNMSRNFRVEITFGVDYKHQAICTTEIPEKMTTMLEDELTELVGEEELLNVEVEFLAANTSSLDYEVEADIKGSSAHMYEAVERAMARILVDACNKYGWEIPFQQITLHQAQVSDQES